MKKKLKIYLADLVYDVVKNNYVVPLNIGYVAAYASELFGKDIEITLFKYPTKLLDAIKSGPPDILGVSNYSWNHRLSLHFCKIAKKYNKNTVVVMGGPNIRVEGNALKAFLAENPNIDYYALNEGEEPFANVVRMILEEGCGGKKRVEGCAAIGEGGFHFAPLEFRKTSRELNNPSPYLGGHLDEFIKDPDMYPLFETNRGCPYTCVYCQWGTSAVSAVKTRPLEQIYRELDYVAEKSAKQVYWIFCDANFGILARDVEIAAKIRSVRDKYGYPMRVELWHSKNTGARNIEIVEVLGGPAFGYVAIQSSDKDVLAKSGRGNIKMDDFRTMVNYFHSKGLSVNTDLLIGLPGETPESHLQSICDSFDIGFSQICPMNIRLLKGTQYESDSMRAEYGVKVKFRPIYGAYGVYDGERILEMEEGVRETKDFTERDLNYFKVVHWLINLCWNTRIFHGLLNYAREHHLNPGNVLDRVAKTDKAELRNIFDDMINEGMREWFDSEEEMLSHFIIEKNFEQLMNNFAKLNQLFIARSYQDPSIIVGLGEEIKNVILSQLGGKEGGHGGILGEILSVNTEVICKDLLGEPATKTMTVSATAAAYILNMEELKGSTQTVSLEISRSREAAEFCKKFFSGNKGVTVEALLRFIDVTGLPYLSNDVRLVKK